MMLAKLSEIVGKSTNDILYLSSLTRWEKYKRVVGLVCESTHQQWAACDETAENRIGTSRSLISKHGRETRRDFTSGNSV